MGSPLPTRSLWTSHQNVMFGGIPFGTIEISLRPSCRSSIKRQGISLTFVTFPFQVLTIIWWRTHISMCFHISLWGSDYIFTFQCLAYSLWGFWNLYQSFLLIVCTHHIFTCFILNKFFAKFIENFSSSVRYSDFPAYSQILLRQLCAYLKRIIVIPAVY